MSPEETALMFDGEVIFDPWTWERQLWLEEHWEGDWPELEGHKAPGKAAENAKCHYCGKPGELRKYKAGDLKIAPHRFRCYHLKCALRLCYGAGLPDTREAGLRSVTPPDTLPGLGQQGMGALAKCAGCNRATFQSYGTTSMCVTCARVVAKLGGGL